MESQHESPEERPAPQLEDQPQPLDSLRKGKSKGKGKKGKMGDGKGKGQHQWKNSSGKSSTWAGGRICHNCKQQLHMQWNCLEPRRQRAMNVEAAQKPGAQSQANSQAAVPSKPNQLAALLKRVDGWDVEVSRRKSEEVRSHVFGQETRMAKTLEERTETYNRLREMDFGIEWESRSEFPYLDVVPLDSISGRMHRMPKKKFQMKRKCVVAVEKDEGEVSDSSWASENHCGEEDPDSSEDSSDERVVQKSSIESAHLVRRHRGLKFASAIEKIGVVSADDSDLHELNSQGRQPNQKPAKHEILQTGTTRSITVLVHHCATGLSHGQPDPEALRRQTQALCPVELQLKLISMVEESQCSRRGWLLILRQGQNGILSQIFQTGKRHAMEVVAGGVLGSPASVSGLGSGGEAQRLERKTTTILMSYCADSIDATKTQRKLGSVAKTCLSLHGGWGGHMHGGTSCGVQCRSRRMEGF